MKNELLYASVVLIIFALAFIHAMHLGAQKERIERNNEALKFQLKQLKRLNLQKERELELNEATMLKIKKELEDAKTKLRSTRAGTNLNHITF